MATRLLLAVTFVCLAWPVSAHAQMDDLLAPLTPKKPKTKPAPKRKGTPTKGKPDSQAPVARAKLQVTHSPSDRPARLFLNGQEKGEIPGAPLELEPGLYSVEVRRPGYSDFKMGVDLSAGDVKQIRAELEPVSAVVEVLSNVDGAEVFLDGRRVGETPLHDLLLPAGSYTLSVRKAGFKEERSDLPVRIGREYSVQATLKPAGGGENRVAASDRPVASSLSPSASSRNASDLPLTEVGTPSTSASVEQKPLYKRWYFWTGAAALAVAAGVGTYALTHDSGPNFPKPDAVCEGPCAAVVADPF